MAKGKPDLVYGTLDMLILRTLLFGPAHGHGIAKHLQRTTDDVLKLEHGSLYPALHRLQDHLEVGDAPARQTRVQVLPVDAARAKAARARGVAVEPRGSRDCVRPRVARKGVTPWRAPTTSIENCRPTSNSRPTSSAIAV